MPNQRVLLELESILEHCQYIHEDASGFTPEIFFEHRLPRQAIERNLGRIAVSASRVRDLDLNLYEDLDLLNPAANVGNELLNGYGDDVDLQAVWDFVAKTNDGLADQIQSVLKAYPK